jgi:serine/threonine protein kinase
MTATSRQLVMELMASGMLSPDKLSVLKQIDQQLSPDHGASTLADVLVKAGVLTGYQASEVVAGRLTHLLLGNYEILEKIGQGGMGVVVKARHRRMDRVVALKLLPAASMNSQTKIRRFHQEVQTAAKLVHPNIVTAYDADTERGIHYLVMEYVDGVDLLTLVQREGPLPMQKAVGYVIQAARGLEYAHERGIVHRDIKPANLLLSTDGTVKILDMGLARPERLETIDARADALTSEGQFMGTADYTAPEQAIDTRSADPRSDQYSLGATLFRLLTGRPMYEADSFLKKVLAHRDAPIPPLREFRQDVSAELDVIYQKMVAKKPQDRYATMDELIRDLRQAVVFDAASAVPPRMRLPSGPTLSPGEARERPTEVMEPPSAIQPLPPQAGGELDRIGATVRQKKHEESLTRIVIVQTSGKAWYVAAASWVVAAAALGVAAWALWFASPQAAPVEAVAPPSVGSWVEVLDDVELDRYVIDGPWKRVDGGGLLSPSDHVSSLGIPMRMPDYYILEIVVDPKQPGPLVIGLPDRHETLALTLDQLVGGQYYSGVGTIDSAGKPSSTLHAGRLLEIGLSTMIRCVVSDEGVTISVGGKTIVDVAGSIPPRVPGSPRSPFNVQRMPYLTTPGACHFYTMRLTALGPG